VLLSNSSLILNQYYFVVVVVYLFFLLDGHTHTFTTNSARKIQSISLTSFLFFSFRLCLFFLNAILRLSLTLTYYFLILHILLFFFFIVILTLYIYIQTNNIDHHQYCCISKWSRNSKENYVIEKTLVLRILLC